MILYCIQDGNTTLPTEQYCTVTSYDKIYRYAINGIANSVFTLAAVWQVVIQNMLFNSCN